jgi:hypothetical protein
MINKLQILLMQKKNNEYQWRRVSDLRFSRFLAHKTMFSASETQIDENRCLMRD